MTFQLSTMCQTLFCAILISVPLLTAFVAAFQVKKVAKPFPFMALPKELRQMVYEELVADQQVRYPAPVVVPLDEDFTWQDWIFWKKIPAPNCNWLILANRQVSQEFHAVLCKKAIFTLYVDQFNFDSPDLWRVSPSTKAEMRICEIKLVTTSNMLGGADPRSMPRNWPLCNRICEMLQDCKKLERVSLTIRAIGDPLWSPLWVWYHASQAFKMASSVEFHTIKFDFDSCTPGENRLVRTRSGNWTWECPQGHFVGHDPADWQPIREFCASIYQDCFDCRSAAS